MYVWIIFPFNCSAYATITIILVIWQAFLVTVRNKKRVGYTYELSLKFKGNFGSFLF
jgi:hypothetical protein